MSKSESKTALMKGILTKLSELLSRFDDFEQEIGGNIASIQERLNYLEIADMKKDYKNYTDNTTDTTDTTDNNTDTTDITDTNIVIQKETSHVSDNKNKKEIKKIKIRASKQDVIYIEYNDGVVFKGNTFDYKDMFKTQYKGFWNPTMKGWILCVPYAKKAKKKIKANIIKKKLDESLSDMGISVFKPKLKLKSEKHSSKKTTIQKGVCALFDD